MNGVFCSPNYLFSPGDTANLLPQHKECSCLCWNSFELSMLERFTYRWNGAEMIGKAKCEARDNETRKRLKKCKIWVNKFKLFCYLSVLVYFYNLPYIFSRLEAVSESSYINIVVFPWQLEINVWRKSNETECIFVSVLANLGSPEVAQEIFLGTIRPLEQTWNIRCSAVNAYLQSCLFEGNNISCTLRGVPNV